MRLVYECARASIRCFTAAAAAAVTGLLVPRWHKRRLISLFVLARRWQLNRYAAEENANSRDLTLYESKQAYAHARVCACVCL